MLEKVPARSGQRAYANTDNRLGKSPIPYGDWILHADKEEQKRVKPVGRGIGWAFHISSSKDNFLSLVTKKITRTAIMLHAENALPGSAGCIVLLSCNDMAKIGAILNDITKQAGNDKTKCKIRLTVFP